MTVKNIKDLVRLTKDYPRDKQIIIAESLPIYDACNYVLWMKKLHNKDIPL